MFNIESKIRARMAPHLQRVLVVDPNLVSSRLLIDLVKDLGAHQRLHAATTKRGLEIAADWQPQLIFVEFSGPGLDGVDFTRRLRRSPIVARTAPVIVVTADTRESSIKASRDAGAHEFLCKPFTAGHVFRRVENVTLKPRPWIEAKMYVGPDRRRFNSGDYEGRRKRRADNAVSTAYALALTHADRSIRAELASIDVDPDAAMQKIMAHTGELQRTASGQTETEIGRAIGALQSYLLSAVENGGLQKDAIEAHLAEIRIVRQKSEGKVVAASPA